MSDRQAQQTIPLHQQVLNNFENFYTGANGELLSRLRSLLGGAGVDGAGPIGLWLWGESGRGRSHLLQAACQAVEANGGRSLFLPLAQLPRDPEVLDGLQAELIALDDIDGWLLDEALEVSLMALYQSQLGTGGRLLLASSSSARQTEFVLADLASRCRALPSYEVYPPDDDGLRKILSAAAHRQGLILSDSVLDFWLHRAVRSLPELLDQLAELDVRALAEQRRVTIPLIKEVLAL